MENPVLNSVEILGNQVYSTDKIEDMLTVKKRRNFKYSSIEYRFGQILKLVIAKMDIF